MTSTNSPMPEPSIDERGGWTSASSADADLLCPGRHQAQLNVPRTEKSDPDAAHGTAIHVALATGDSSKLTREQRKTYEACDQIASEVVTRFFGTQVPPAASERRLWATYQPIIDGEVKEVRHSGKLDRVYTVDQRALIIEFKTLAGDVPASSSNQQLRDQAVLVWGASAVPTDRPGVVDYRIRQVACAVVQPLVTHNPEICVYEEQDLIRAAQEMYNRVMASNSPNAQRIPGEIQCKFCRACDTCLEYQSWATKTLAVAPVSILGIAPKDWHPDQRAAFCSRRAIMQKWLDDTADAMKTLLEANPDAIPGFQLRDGHTVRRIQNPQALFDRFALLPTADATLTFEKKLELYMSAVSVGIGDLEDAVNQLTGHKGKKLESTVDRLLEGIVEIKKNKPSIVKKAQKAIK